MNLLSFYFSPPPKKERLDGYISMIHNEFLKKICDESDLKGLVYHGGPKVECQRCEWSGVLACVEYPGDVNHSTEIKCEECNQRYNTNELLRVQASHNKPRAHDDVIFIAEVIPLPRASTIKLMSLCTLE